jgi:hypothetical protein
MSVKIDIEYSINPLDRKDLTAKIIVKLPTNTKLECLAPQYLDPELQVLGIPLDCNWGTLDTLGNFRSYWLIVSASNWTDLETKALSLKSETEITLHEVVSDYTTLVEKMPTSYETVYLADKFLDRASTEFVQLNTSLSILN